MCKVTLGLGQYDRLDGTSNFVPWELRLQLLMEEANLWEHVEKEIPKPTNLAQFVAHQKKEAKVKRIVLDYVKDHFISNISDNKTGTKMFDSLVELL
jgi:hypothetical protein